ncbi:MAG: hypothetical protein CO093_07535 [Alphaproteobacteria bacterium CG_4_9_14_3_um_filter_47_13]|nr:MAG: hypothetical protein CO093_07535 [Alphaproteobacteria bacterium CG_4_9_14_3_um_filter_47_13]
MTGSAIYPQFEGLKLTAKQQEFVVLYCRPDMGFNAARAYRKAYGLSTKDSESAKRSASRLLTKVHVSTAIHIECSRRLALHDDIARQVMAEWYKMMTLDIFSVLTIEGGVVKLRPLEEIPPVALSCIKELHNTQQGISVTFMDKHKAMESLAKALGVYSSSHSQTGNEPYEALVVRLARENPE